MIEEIKRKLKGNRVFLKCINKEEFISKDEVNREILNLEEIEVQYYLEEDSDFFGGLQLIASESFLEDKGLVIGDMFISNNEIEYFEIIESPYIKDNPTFNDLIDTAVQANKDKVLPHIELRENEIYLYKFGIVKDDVSCDVFANAISDINSLYIETFVIESEEDIKPFRNLVESIVLANGEDIINDVMFHRGRPYFTKGDGNGAFEVGFNILKGATVTQKRGK